jgi:hypothetical protein
MDIAGNSSHEKTKGWFPLANPSQKTAKAPSRTEAISNDLQGFARAVISGFVIALVVVIERSKESWSAGIRVGSGEYRLDKAKHVLTGSTLRVVTPFMMPCVIAFRRRASADASPREA